MSFLRIYWRALGLLWPEVWLAGLIAVAGTALALVQFAEPLLFGAVIDALTKGEAAAGLVGLWALFGFLSVAAGVFVALQADRLAHRRRLAVMRRYFEHVIGLPGSFHSGAQSGRLIGVMLKGSDTLFGLWLSAFREQVTALVSLVVLLPVAFSMNAEMAALLLALMVVYVVLNGLVMRKTQAGQADAAAYHAALSGRVGDVIANVTLVQSFTRLQEETQALRELMGRLLAVQNPVLTWWAMTSILTRAASTLTIVAMFALGTVLHARGAVSVGEIVSFVGFATLLIGRLDNITAFVTRLFLDAPAMQQFFEVLDAAGDLPEKPGARPLVVPKGHVVFEGVSFRYPDGGAGLSDLDFEARPGETVALVGPTGSGKSTILALLQRLRDPAEGRVLIDGTDIRDVTLDSLRRQIAVVAQNAGLFDRSIAENLRIGRPDASDADIRAAADLAEATGFILSRPEGFDARCGEQGKALSGGERQRLAIARALLKDAPILILDEATSALDTETEAKVKRALDHLRAGRTTFIIAHRLSTIRDADQILFLEEGRIVERGRFAELVAQGGRFADLVRAGAFDAAEGGSSTP
ncbi:glucan ABC transporter ATP-binding protein/ permease [Pannonibacter tanglangensis]|uniref:Glucan ABC transporter ATP-binding protein/ permease n=1 Tax=Pannonibacter tanglangensis TaxID=2750084 RepID=A0ABW9ZID7_9HYPH|nr:glucan ABC transporter ATP-binding protein/ permease [Pannonibacter sp. XCT-34]NBN62490.1 glucan ABC transporter ATP-binding protein/ permease [Pannonibacter sp. XCT-34]